MRFYTNLQNLSANLIRQFGQPCLIKSQKTGMYDPQTSTVTTETVEQQAHCLFDNLAFDFTSRSSSVMVEKGDVLLYLTQEANPTLNAEVWVGNERWLILTCQPIKPANTALLYQCQARLRE